MLKARDIENLTQLNELSKMTPEMIRKMPTYHIIILAKNDVGRINLYRLISPVKPDVFCKTSADSEESAGEPPRGADSWIGVRGGRAVSGDPARGSGGGTGKNREFLRLSGSAAAWKQRIYAADEKSSVNTWEDLQDLNRKVIELGEQWNKLVCATCDVHFLDPEDEVYRRIIMASKGFKDADDQAPLYLRTTEEMLGEFEYLGSDKAEEIVITNTRKIAAMCERISPVRPDKCPPVIPNSDDTLRTICYNHAHDMYGDKLPKVVVDRLERELHSIISMDSPLCISSRRSWFGSRMRMDIWLVREDPLVPRWRRRCLVSRR